MRGRCTRPSSGGALLAAIVLHDIGYAPEAADVGSTPSTERASSSGSAEMSSSPNGSRTSDDATRDSDSSPGVHDDQFNIPRTVSDQIDVNANILPVHGSDRLVQELVDPCPSVPVDAPVPEVERLFRRDRSLRAVVVTGAAVPALLTREHLAEELTGTYGFGRSLHTRSRVADLLAGEECVLPHDISLVEAARRIMQRTRDTRYRDVLVVDRNRPLGVVSITALFEALADVFEQIASHDPLTQLPNRRLLEERGQRVLPDWIGCGRFAVLYVDLDGFKPVNDTLGHRAGDDVLVQFAQRLSSCVRPSDLVARVGGDEFALLLLDATAEQAQVIADRVVLAASAPFTIDGESVFVSASVGLAVPDDVPATCSLTPLDMLLRRADTAMLEAKRRGKGRSMRLTSPSDAALPERRAAIRLRLRAAMESGTGLSLHYQPKLDLATGRQTTVEALLRWTDGILGPVSPAEFIPVAESSGQILRLGQWVLEQACEQLERWMRAGQERAVAVNVSPLQLAVPTLADDILQLLDQHGIPPRLFKVEVTEQAAVADLVHARAQLERLLCAGVGVALDDFGTGYSSLGRLRDLPITIVKIDKSIVDRVDTDTAEALLIGGVIDAAHALGLTVTAEGVERQSQLECLRQLGCDTVQGFLIARPQPADQLPTGSAATAPLSLFT